MKNKYTRLLSVILIICIVGITLLTSCTPAYKEFHTEDNVAVTNEIADEKLTAYFFILDDGSAVMDICRENGDRVQRLEFPTADEHYASLDFDYAFENAVFQDMNFDGVDDLYVPCSVTTENLEGLAWLWDGEAGEFVLSEELSALYELTVFPDEELITSQDYSHPDGILCSEYKWEEGKLVKIGEYTVNTAS